MTPPAKRSPAPAIKVIDNTITTDEELQAAIVRLVALVQGLESATHSCACGRYYRLGMSAELQAVLMTIRKAVYQRTGEELASDSRWPWVEID
jgi:hypothetical protein